MNSVVKDLDNLINNIKAPKPIFDITNGYGGGISMRLSNSKKEVPKEYSRLYEIVSYYIKARYDDTSRSIKLGYDDRAVNRIYEKVISDTTYFISQFSNAKNPKLTSLYKWYVSNIDNHILRTNTDILNLLYETWKYVGDLDNNKANKENVTAIYEVIKNKLKNRI